jgi:hypothetical protein
MMGSILVEFAEDICQKRSKGHAVRVIRLRFAGRAGSRAFPCRLCPACRWAIMPLLIVGGAFLCFEGYEKSTLCLSAMPMMRQMMSRREKISPKNWSVSAQQARSEPISYYRQRSSPSPTPLSHSCRLPHGCPCSCRWASELRLPYKEHLTCSRPLAAEW